MDGDFPRVCLNGLGFYRSAALLRLEFVDHAFLTRRGGVSEGDFESLNLSYSVSDCDKKVAANWDILAKAFSLSPEDFVTVRQVHGDRVLVLKGGRAEPRDPRLRNEGFDALVTDEPGLVLAVKTADCVPILLADPVRKAIGIVHAGWRGTALAVAKKAVRAMGDAFGCEPSDMVAVLGPAIGPCCYQVGRLVFEALGGVGADREYLRPAAEDGQWRLDLPGINRRQLLKEGLEKGRITSGSICTVCQKDIFFSHRAQGGKAGRQVSFIRIAPAAKKNTTKHLT